MLDESLQMAGVGVCIKNTRREVIEQNALCRQVCGDCRGSACERGCMRLYAQDNARQWKDWGSIVYRNSFIHAAWFDVTLLRSADHIITFLQPLQDKYDQALAYYRDKGLTQRETDVVALSIRGASNADICKSLSISRATLRTHLNNIYRKLRELGEEPAFMPSNRVVN